MVEKLWVTMQFGFGFFVNGLWRELMVSLVIFSESISSGQPVLINLWCLIEILKLMLGQNSEDEICSRFVFELVIWPKQVTLVSWTQPSGPLCLWQCFISRPISLFCAIFLMYPSSLRWAATMSLPFDFSHFFFQMSHLFLSFSAKRTLRTSSVCCFLRDWVADMIV